MVVVDVLVVVEDVAEIGGSDVSGTEEAVVEVVLEVLVVIVVSATGAGGKPCASGAVSAVVVVSDDGTSVVAAAAPPADVDVPDSLSLPEEQDAASKAAASVIAM